MQSRRASAVEAAMNPVIGFFFSMGIWQFVGPLFGYEVTLADNFMITSIFFVTSMLRSYALRRIFNSFSRREL